MSLHPDWLDAIDDPATYPHAVSQIQLHETHISWVILTGDWVYKLKKPVNLGFVDFSTLELRRADCYEELRLNRRTAPELYDDVIPLVANADRPHFGGTGTVLEYAVRMRQFPQENLLEQCLGRGELSPDLIEMLAREIAELHRHAAVASLDTPYGEPRLIRETVQTCLDVLTETALPDTLRHQLQPLSHWMVAEGDRLHQRFVARKQQGWVRECHGDLHLGNLVLYRGKPTLFDCLEFNSRLRWIDIISDIGFLIMDLYDHAATPLAWRALNHWLELTGDYEGLIVLKYYMVYRALVRAKVAAIRLHQPELSPEEEQHEHKLLRRYIELAMELTRSGHAAILLMHGVSGSGKTFVARELASSLEAVQIRSDVERKRHIGIQPASTQTRPADSTLYSDQTNRETYCRLKSLAKSIVDAGYPVIVDAAFLKRADRYVFASLANELSIPFVIVACHAPESVLRARIVGRHAVGRDASDADLDVLHGQLMTVEPLDAIEKNVTVDLNTARDELSSALRVIQNRIRCEESPITPILS